MIIIKSGGQFSGEIVGSFQAKKTSLYENGISPADIVLKTSHSQGAVDRYIKHYEQVKKLCKKGLDEKAIMSITGRSLNVIRQYIKLYKNFNPQKTKK